MGKGGVNERDVSKFLTKWLTGSTKPYMFWRQEASGALATIHIENDHMTGDIKHLHPDSKFFTDIFSIECKTGYPKTSFWQHFSSAEFGVEEFWKQTLEDCRKSKKHPMLIYRKKHRQWIVGIGKEIEGKLHDRIKGLNRIVINWGCGRLPKCILYDMKAFFKLVKPEDIRNLWQH